MAKAPTLRKAKSEPGQRKTTHFRRSCGCDENGGRTCGVRGGRGGRADSSARYSLGGELLRGCVVPANVGMWPNPGLVSIDGADTFI